MSPAKKSCQVSIKLEPELFARLKARADAERRTLGQLARLALEEFLHFYGDGSAPPRGILDGQGKRRGNGKTPRIAPPGKGKNPQITPIAYKGGKR